MNHFIASREPAWFRWTASLAIGKMQLDGPTHSRQFSISPRRMAMIPSMALIRFRTVAGATSGRLDSRAFSSQGRLEKVPSYMYMKPIDCSSCTFSRICSRLGFESSLVCA